MIQNKKRAAENPKGAGEPAKKKQFKEGNKGVSKFNKADKGQNNFKGKQGKFGGKNLKGNFKNNGKPFKKDFGDKFKPKATEHPTLPAEKTDWAKFKKDKKELKMKRKKSKDIYEISVEAKQIFEKLRIRRTEKKAELVEKLYNLLISGEDIFKKMTMAHDTSRIIQCMLKYSTPSLREQISEKLLPLTVEMAVSKYSHFCVKRMFRYGSPTTKSKLIDTFFGHIVKLASHNISSKLLDHAYLTVATAQQKSLMRQEFYGDLYKKSKDKNVTTLTDTYKDTPGMKSSILGAVKSNLEHVVNKQLIDNSLVHAVMLEYMREIDEEKMEETVTLFGPHIPLMLTTKEGCQAAIICFYKSNAKNRRAIIKAFKEHLIKICTHEHGHVFILAVLNCLDDTKATKKAIYDTLHPELQTLLSNQWGRRVIEWLVNPADTNSFHPAFIATLDEGLQYGKKDKDIRRKEIFDQIEEPIATAIAEYPVFWLSDRHIGLVTAEILKKIGATYFEQAVEALAKVIVNPKWTVMVEDENAEKKPKKAHDFEKIIAEATKTKKAKKQKQSAKTEEFENDNEDDSDMDEAKQEESEANTIAVPGIEEAGLHIVLKKILKGDRDRVGSKTFGSALVQEMQPETLDYWVTVNRACFILLNILENNNEETAAILKEHIKAKMPLLEQQSSSGSKLLLKKTL